MEGSIGSSKAYLLQFTASKKRGVKRRVKRFELKGLNQSDRLYSTITAATGLPLDLHLFLIGLLYNSTNEVVHFVDIEGPCANLPAADEPVALAVPNSFLACQFCVCRK